LRTTFKKLFGSAHLRAEVGGATVRNDYQGALMRKAMTCVATTAALSVLPVSGAFATTPPEDPNDVVAVDNPIDDNDASGFDDWGLFGLLGLSGLMGLKRRDDDRVAPARESARV
jgi:hypothetical protein